ncbi:START-like domain superfamily [Sesbania bispinosa]|nr:START-like domain superfamily [Sesbania bispinosa]
MSATASVISTTPALTRSSSRTRRTNFGANFTFRSSFPATPLSSNHPFFTFPRTKQTPTFHRFKRFSPVMEWQDCKVKMEIDVPVSVAFACYSDREAIPNWMPFISSVKITFLQPIPNQKIHWRSLEGLPNRGAVRFYPKGSSSCVVELTVSYEVPQLLAPVASC